MNRTYQVLSVTAIALAVLVAACRKSGPQQKNDPYFPGVTGSPPSTYPPTPTPSLAILFSDLKPTPEIITIPAGIAQTVYAAKGTQFNFYPNSFKDAYGKTITSGNVQVEITEMYKPGDMIANRASTTTTTGDILESGGQVYIKATMSGQPVYPNVYGIGFPQATADSTKKMSIFIGNTTASPDGVTTWKMGDTAKNGRTANGTTWTGSGGSGNSRYIFDSCTDFNWINCDRLHDYWGPRTDIRIVMPDSSFDKGNTQAMIILPEIKSVVRTNYTKADTAFKLANDYMHQAPIGMAVSIVVMAKKNDIYYYYEQKGGNIVDSMKVYAKMKPVSRDSVKIKLSNL